MKISKCDNSLIPQKKQAVIVGANCIRPKQRFTTGRIQYDPTIMGRERKNIKNTVTFVTFVTLHSLTCLLVNLFTLKIK